MHGGGGYNVFSDTSPEGTGHRDMTEGKGVQKVQIFVTSFISDTLHKNIEKSLSASVGCGESIKSFIRGQFLEGFFWGGGGRFIIFIK